MIKTPIKILLAIFVIALFLAPMAIWAVADDQTVESAQDEQLLSFVMISHFHKTLIDPPSGVMARAVAKINQLNPDFVMFLGDYIWGYENFIKDWEKFNALADQIEADKFIIAGNHELTNRPNDQVVSDLTKLEYFKQNVGDLYYSFEKDNNLFIALNSFTFYDGILRDDMDNEQLAFLQTEVDKHAQYQNVFIFTSQCSWLESANNWHHKVTPIIKDKADYVICGTKGTPYYTKMDGITYVMSGINLKSQVYNKNFFVHATVSASGQVAMIPILIDDGNFLELEEFYLDPEAEGVNYHPAIYGYSRWRDWLETHTILVTVVLVIIGVLLGLIAGLRIRKQNG